MDKKEKEPKKMTKSQKVLLIIGMIVCAIIGGFFGGKLGRDLANFEDTTHHENKIKKEELLSPYQLKGNSLEDFDLYFLQLENEKENKVYSPLSIKYALEMLEEGSKGETKKQISDIIGTYKAKKYSNSKNMSLANALFVKDSFKKYMKKNYLNNLLNKYNAEVIYDSFKSPDVLNSWVKNKTLNLINKAVDDVSETDFILMNALAIDMEWVNKIQGDYFCVFYNHRNFHSKIIAGIEIKYIDFDNLKAKIPALPIGVVVNRYDIINELGEDNIRKTVKKEYEKWIAKGADGIGPEYIEDVDTYLDSYIKEIAEGYKDVRSSTDFSFYTDDNVKVFAKDLKEYNGTTLQYIGIMPTKDNLDNYIKDVKAENINTLINNLKDIKLENFKEGVITEITGYIPMFKFDYELKLINDLNKLGVTNVFNQTKADLSNLTSMKGAYIYKAIHKANIEFSNEGIKASALSGLGGLGGGGYFDYIYEVPVEYIDLTFDKPYMFLIRDKETGEVWFVGTVYEPQKEDPEIKDEYEP